MFEVLEWLVKREAALRGQIFADCDARLALTVDLALENVDAGGGPFGAAVFDAEGRLIALGANLVMLIGQSDAHAEMVAMSRAQDSLGRVHLTGCILASSCEPCAMCSCGLLWGGVSVLEYAAPGTSARVIGFDEGDKTSDWNARLEARGIVVRGPRLDPSVRDAPFVRYRDAQGSIY